MDIISQNIVYFIIVIAIIAILLAWAYATNRVQQDFNTMTWVLIPVSIAINITIGQIVLVLKLPVYLDSIGTVLVAVSMRTMGWRFTGMLSNIIWGRLPIPMHSPGFRLRFSSVSYPASAQKEVV